MSWIGLPIMASAAAFASPSLAPAQADGVRFVHADHVLGTSFDFTLVGSETDALLAADAARAEIARLDRKFSVWRDDSEIAQFNRTRTRIVSPDLYALLARAEHWRLETNGAFNVQLGLVEAAWRRAARDGEAPDAALLDRLTRLAQTPTAFDPRIREISRPRLTRFAPDAIAKGYVIDAAFAAARRAAPGSRGLKLDIGGDLRVCGEAPGGGAWRIGVANPLQGADNAAPIQTLALSDQAIAASGRGARDLIVAGASHAHFFDPRDGRPATAVAAAAVVAPNAMDADALATAFTILTPEESVAFANRTPGVETLVLAADGAAHASHGWDALVVRDSDAAARLTPAQASAATPWPANFQLDIQIELPAIEASNYRKPYVLVWITDANRQPVRTLLMLGDHERWQDDNYVWWRRVGRLTPGMVDAMARPTRAPGRYTLVWDGRDDSGQIVGQGAYTLNIEAVREHGGHSYVSAPLNLGAAPIAASTPADAELGAASANYGPRR